MSTVTEPPVGVSPLRVHALGDIDRAELAALVDTDPVVNAVLASRLRAIGTLAPRIFGGTTFGTRAGDGRLTAAVFSGGNVLPVGGGPAEWAALGVRLAELERPCTSIVGRADAVGGLWGELAAPWGPARLVRRAQPLLLLDDGAALPAGDRRVRAVRSSEIEAYLPAAAAMFREELGVAPQADGSGDYRRRVTGLVRQGRALGIVDERGDVVFKADIGAVSERTCQVQGVWVRPDRRGRGLGSAALPAVLRHALTLAPTVSLYVNDFNTPARRMYARLGLREHAVLSTILF